MGVQTIELDTSRPWEPPPERHRVPPRWLVAALALVLAPFVLVRDAPPGPSQAPLLTLRQVGVMVFVGGDLLYEVPVDPLQPQRIRVHDLVTRQVRWELDYGPDEASWTAFGDVLFQSLTRTGVDRNRPPLLREFDPPTPQVLRAYDPRTGRVLWERGNATAEVALDAVTILVEWPAQTGEVPPPDQPAPPARMHAVQSRTGKVIWTRTLADSWSFLRRSSDRADPVGERSREELRLVELSPAGELRITDLISGEAVSVVRLPITGTPHLVDAVDAIVSVRDGGELSSYDAGTGRLLWRAQMPDGATPCGRDYVCVAEYPGAGEFRLRVLRRSTGEVLLDVPGVMPTGAMGDRVLIQPDFRSGVSDTSVVDLAGDRVPRSLAPWGSARAVDEDRVLAVSRGTRRRETTVAVIDINTMHATVVGRAPGWHVPPDCNVWGDYVVCSSTSEHAVWRYPSGRPTGRSASRGR